MTVYIDLVILLNFLVDTLLLLGVNRLTGYPANATRSAAAGILGGIYGGLCLLPGFHFLSNAIWRTVTLFGIAATAFGINRSMIRRGGLFTLLNMSLGGIALGFNTGGFWSILCGAAAVLLLCTYCLRGQIKHRVYVPVELTWHGKVRKLTALIDTGNVLTDPVTGQRVLIVNSDIAREMLNLSCEQLQNPVITLAEHPVPGLRLIPYRTVGQTSGMLLAVKMDKVVVDGRIENKLVAFAPTEIGKEDGYQALTGG